jgi:hypothetical protein
MTRIFAAAAAALFLMPASPASADGALAVGSTENIVKDGIAMGYSLDKDSEADAGKVALGECKDFKAKKAAQQCRVIGTFKNECFAVAMDPKDGTTGVGWAIAARKPVAETRALESCKATAGAARVNYCAVSESDCDGSAK